MTMLNLVKSNRLYFALYLLIFGCGTAFLLSNEHGDLVLWFANNRTPFLNFFFRHWTHTGGWIFVILVVVAFLFRELRTGLILGLVMVVQSLVTAFLKQLIFPNVPRPISYFKDIDVLNLIEGVAVKEMHSFPSGHTMTAFALATFMVLHFRNKEISVLLLLGATLTAISRMYVAQHFLVDTLAGSMVGVFIALSIYATFLNYMKNGR